MGPFFFLPSSSRPGAPPGLLGPVEFTLATLPLISNQYIELGVNVSVHQRPCPPLGVGKVSVEARKGMLGSEPGEVSCPEILPHWLSPLQPSREERSW